MPPAPNHEHQTTMIVCGGLRSFRVRLPAAPEHDFPDIPGLSKMDQYLIIAQRQRVDDRLRAVEETQRGILERLSRLERSLERSLESNFGEGLSRATNTATNTANGVAEASAAGAENPDAQAGSTQTTTESSREHNAQEIRTERK
ncbi:hypothetical protein A1Q1_00870 [Trichosporon asahii var. asahii CBS 2479]|uniref:Uncharacterized protein n=1 Tax=Trichosporon asahii var. asahii (strain ATCC 90039 / CBS 2479 / JCM 2466 / KCTC 7840 / NBRC 103889/ NCYC 2677 / UAMH 7654) TaxID=1186058 RepID=J6EZF1_TRIAS|nr:hypothetical protein A1Q1_00870 [Trichosporon asahii var. asahii CBS 2479]EJT50029.1 hypothetical protein A1Q1_00870 [Trichosporon asahii var. asahii CBS 2479]